MSGGSIVLSLWHVRAIDSFHDVNTFLFTCSRFLSLHRSSKNLVGFLSISLLGTR